MKYSFICLEPCSWAAHPPIHFTDSVFPGSADSSIEQVNESVPGLFPEGVNLISCWVVVVLPHLAPGILALYLPTSHTLHSPFCLLLSALCDL